jgi:hypothetical protein
MMFANFFSITEANGFTRPGLILIESSLRKNKAQGYSNKNIEQPTREQEDVMLVVCKRGKIQHVIWKRHKNKTLIKSHDARKALYSATFFLCSSTAFNLSCSTNSFKDKIVVSLFIRIFEEELLFKNCSSSKIGSITTPIPVNLKKMSPTTQKDKNTTQLKNIKLQYEAMNQEMPQKNIIHSHYFPAFLKVSQI